MQPTPTGIAVALALVVVAAFFIFPGLSPFNQPSADEAAVLGAATTTQTITPMPDATQLQMTDEVLGTGAAAAVGDTVTVHYVGSLTNGTIFDASANHGTTGFSFVLGAGQVIAGWDRGIVGMKVGGKRQLVIPAALAYGDQAIENIIPANSTLVFEVELLKVEKAGQ
ncbi:MAG: FKBP-type peptidyl-prolyl cis-trans isomerase [Deltaproteobacteria bacterium]|nr:FKBP-type peptidyl-prolyl cis-trans isomerase [Deltaproteobacteria bacterium]